MGVRPGVPRRHRPRRGRLQWYHIDKERRRVQAHWRARASTVADDRARLSRRWLAARRADAEVLAGLAVRARQPWAVAPPTAAGSSRTSTSVREGVRLRRHLHRRSAGTHRGALHRRQRSERGRSPRRARRRAGPARSAWTCRPSPSDRKLLSISAVPVVRGRAGPPRARRHGAPHEPETGPLPAPDRGDGPDADGRDPPVPRRRARTRTTSRRSATPPRDGRSPSAARSRRSRPRRARPPPGRTPSPS